MQIILKNRLPILSGVLIGTSYIPFWPWAIGFCFVPLWSEILNSNLSFKETFKKSWWTQFTLAVIGFYWVSYVSHEYGFMPWPIAILVLLLFAATIHLYIPFSIAVANWLRQKYQLHNLSALLLMSFGIVLGEIYWPRLFPWNFGYTFLKSGTQVFQIADTIGFIGLSLIILIINALVTYAYLSKKRSYWIAIISSVAIFVVVFHLLGSTKKQKWTYTDSSINITQIQANIGNNEKLEAESGTGSQEFISNKFFKMTQSALSLHPQTELFIWPESAYPDFLNANERYRTYSSKFYDFIRILNKPILTGAFSRIENPGKRAFDFNALFLISPDGKIFGEPYHKTNLLIFGEFTPFTDYFPSLAKISPAGMGWDRGDGPHIIPFHDIRIGPQICYESLYPDFSNKLSNLGATLLINITNDSWFGPTHENDQHMLMTLARAIEVRRPLIRNTNTGISTAILANGVQLEKSPKESEWFFSYKIDYLKNPEQTFYAKYGHLFTYLVVILFLFTFFIGKGKAKS